MVTWLVIAITVGCLVTLRVTYEVGFVRGSRRVVFLAPVEDNMTEFYGFLKTLPQTQRSGTPMQGRGSDNMG